jgi:glycerol kinase
MALDQGTTSSRTILFDAKGKPVATAQQEFTQHFPQPGWVEHDAEEIWQTQLDTAKQALAKAGVAANEVAGIGITNQRETTVVWDRESGLPVCRAIVWQDRRTAAMCNELKEAGHAETIHRKTGLVVDAYFSGSKIRWILDNVEGARARARKGELAFGTVDSWLIWNLTGGKSHITDVSNASRTMLFNIGTMQWDDELLDLLEVEKSLLPEVRSSSEVYGETLAKVFGTAIPLAGIAGDQQAALFGQACHKPGMAKNTYGTGCFLLMNTGTKPVFSKNHLLTTVAWKIGGKVEYALEGSVFIAGAVVQWLRDQLDLVESAEGIEELAASVDSSDGVYFVPAFTGLGAPHWEPDARGLIVGLTRGSGKGHIARAALEGIAYQSEELLRAMEADSGIQLEELRVDGGASMNGMLMQFQADILRTHVVRSESPETTALGVAYLAGLATGVWKNQQEIAEQWAVAQRYEPQMESGEVARRLERWDRAVSLSKGWGCEE